MTSQSLDLRKFCATAVQSRTSEWNQVNGSDIAFRSRFFRGKYLFLLAWQETFPRKLFHLYGKLVTHSTVYSKVSSQINRAQSWDHNSQTGMYSINQINYVTMAVSPPQLLFVNNPIKVMNAVLAAFQLLLHSFSALADQFSTTQQPSSCIIIFM